MASAWGASWGAYWGDSWGSVGAAATQSGEARLNNAAAAGGYRGWGFRVAATPKLVPKPERRKRVLGVGVSPAEALQAELDAYETRLASLDARLLEVEAENAAKAARIARQREDMARLIAEAMAALEAARIDDEEALLLLAAV